VSWSLRGGRGAWVKLPTPESVELLALAGLDFVVVDAEHAALDQRTVAALIGVAHGCGIRAFVRVAGTTPRDVQAPLDAGAGGIVVPQVESAIAARAAVEVVRFPPLGRRGASPSGRAGRWGLLDVAEYVAAGNDDVHLVLQIETLTSFDGAVEIGSTPGVDAVFVGPTDLAVSSGLAVDDPMLTAASRAVRRRCQDAGVLVGSVAAAHSAADYDFLVLGADTSMLHDGARRLLERAPRPAAATA
jgi:4-hydroxy-2-oxoheptanedioate aldolase